MNLTDKISEYINEVAYMGNIGFQEMVEFYKEASNAEVKEMEKILKQGDWPAFTRLIKRVLGVSLK